MQGLASDDELRNKILLGQYQRCVEDWRHFDKLLWQIPFSTATVVSAVIAVAYGYFGEKISYPLIEVKIPLFASLIIFVFTMASLSRKIRFFQESRTKFAENIEENIVKIEKVPVETEKICKFFEKYRESKRFIKYRVVHFSILLYVSFIGTLLYLLIREGLWGIMAIVVTIFFICLALFYDKICRIIN